MDKKSKIILVVLVLAILMSLGVTYYRTIISHDFEVINIETE